MQIKSDKERITDKSATLLALLCTVAYVFSYLGRKTFDSNINEIMLDFSVDKSTVGLVGTCFFIAYALGQVIHGLLCKNYNLKIAVFVALIIGGLMNLLLAVIPRTSFYLVKYIWLVNGFSQATLWPCIILICNRYIAKNRKGIAIFLLSLPVSIGTFSCYGLSALFSFLKCYNVIFYVSFGGLTAMAVFWLFSFHKTSENCRAEKLKFDGEEIIELNKAEKNNVKFTFSIVAPFVVLCLLAIIDNFVKDGLITWTPTILKEKFGLENWISVLLTLLLPLCAVCGSNVVLLIHKKIKNLVFLVGLQFTVALITGGLLILFIDLSVWIVFLLGFMLMVLTMSGINNVITNIYPMTGTKKINAGMAAGLLDGFCYVGSAISAYGLGSVSQALGWNTVLYIFAIACAIGGALCLIFNANELAKKRKFAKI